MTPELIERLARKMALAAMYDPDEGASNGRAKWRDYAALAQVAIEFAGAAPTPREAELEAALLALLPIAEAYVKDFRAGLSQTGRLLLEERIIAARLALNPAHGKEPKDE